MDRPIFDKMLTDSLPAIEEAVQKYAFKYGILNEWRDIAQDVILKLLRFADIYSPCKGDFLPWACVAIINTIKTRIAQVAARPIMREFDGMIIKQTFSTNDPESDLQASQILDNLNEEARLYTEGYNYREIAARCGFKSKVTAMNRINNCTNRLSYMMRMNGERVKRAKVFSKNPA